MSKMLMSFRHAIMEKLKEHVVTMNKKGYSGIPFPMMVRSPNSRGTIHVKFTYDEEKEPWLTRDDDNTIIDWNTLSDDQLEYIEDRVTWGINTTIADGDYPGKVV